MVNVNIEDGKFNLYDLPASYIGIMNRCEIFCLLRALSLYFVAAEIIFVESK